MLLAKQLPPAVAAVIGLIMLVVLAVMALVLFRAYEKFARRALARKYTGIAIHYPPRPGDVILVFDTYHGLIAWFSVAHHELALPPNDARILLGRLLRFNLSWGLLTWGVLFIPAFSILHYIGQRRSITRQELAGGVPVESSYATPDDSSQPSDNAISENPYAAAQTVGDAAPAAGQTSVFRQIIGWISAGLSVLFGVTTVTQAIQGEFGTAASGTFITLILGWVARDFIKSTTD